MSQKWDGPEVQTSISIVDATWISRAALSKTPGACNREKPHSRGSRRKGSRIQHSQTALFGPSCCVLDVVLFNCGKEKVVMGGFLLHGRGQDRGKVPYTDTPIWLPKSIFTSETVDGQPEYIGNTSIAYWELSGTYTIL
ncbi:hypothetical protein C8R43DRAFT_944204 [Mycena crocata]|nr:hypothetical protein C8R43DRAFT_944204 [Mycena crocata]